MVGEKRKVKERRGFFFSFYAHVFFLLNSQTHICFLFCFLLCFLSSPLYTSPLTSTAQHLLSPQGCLIKVKETKTKTSFTLTLL